MLRSVLAVLAGYLVFGVTAALLFQITGHDPHAPATRTFAVLSIIYGAVFAATGGYLAGFIAKGCEFVHGCMVAALIGLGASISLIASPGAGAIWSQVSALLIMAPMAAVGGFLSAIRAKRRISTPEDSRPVTD